MAFAIEDLFFPGQAGGIWSYSAAVGSPVDFFANALASGHPLLPVTSSCKPVAGQYPLNGIRNRVVNNMAVGIVPGSPGTLPTNTNGDSIPAWCTRTVGDGVDGDGVPYATVRVQGTPNNDTTYSFYLASPISAANHGVAAKQGDKWVASHYLKLVAGSFAGLGFINNHLAERYASGSGITSTNDSIASIGSTFTRFASTRVLSSPAVELVNFDPRMQPVSGVPVDFTLAIKLSQLERDSLTAPQMVRSLSNVTESSVESVPMAYFSNDCITTEHAGFGLATHGLYAAPGQNWSLLLAFLTFSDGVLCEQGDMFVLSIEDGVLVVGARGEVNNTGYKVDTGLPQRLSIVCSDGALTLCLGAGSRIALTVGSYDADETPIVFGSNYQGFLQPEAMADRAFEEDEETLALNDMASRYGPQ